MRRAVVKLGMSAMATGTGAVRHNGVAVAGAKRSDAPANLRCPFPLRNSTHVMQARRGLAWVAQAQTTARSTVAHAGGAQWGAAEESQVSDYKVASMPFDNMASNAISLIGFTGRDLEVKRLQSGKTVGTVTLAVNHKAGETSWYDIELWGPMAERIAEQVPKGSRVCIQGKLNPSSWTNREGIKQTKLRITANEVRFVERDGGVLAVSAGQAGWGAQQPQQQQAWGAAQEQFDQAPPSGAEWGNANNVVPSAQGMPQRQSAGPISAESSAEEKWNSVRSNPELWWDNRLNKRNPKGPDYSLKDRSGGSIALWLNSRDTPEWAKQELQVSASALQSSGFTDMN